MNELRHPSTPLGIVNETLDKTITIIENRSEADYHMVTRPTKIFLERKNPESSIFHPKNTLTFNSNLVTNEKFEYFGDLILTTLGMQHYLTEEMKINCFHAQLI